MNEEDILKQLQEYFFQNRKVERQYDPEQGKVWTDSYSLPQLMQQMGQVNTQRQHAGPSNMWDQNSRTMQQLLEMRNKKYQM